MMSKKGGKATPRGQLDKAENRTTPTNEFIPGIPDQEWEILQEIEERDSFLCEIVDDLVSNSLDLISKKWVENLAVSEAVDQVCAVLQDAVDVYFISHDQGIPNFEKAWAEDEPPTASIIDSWTNWKVPVVTSSQERSDSRMTASTSSSIIAVEAEKCRENENVKKNYFLGPSAGSNLLEKTITQSESKAKSSQKAVNKPKQFKRYTGSLNSAKLKNIGTSLQESEEKLLKSQIKQHTANKQILSQLKGVPKNFSTTLKLGQKAKSLVEFDALGNVTHVEKISPEDLPPLQRAKPKVKIEKSQIKSHKAKIKPLRKSSYQRQADDVIQRQVSSNHLLDRETRFESSKDVLGSPRTSTRVENLAPIRLVHPPKLNPADIVK